MAATDPEVLVRAVLDLREKHLNLSQQEFARKIGVSLATVQGWESIDRRGPKMEMWRKLAEFSTEAGAPAIARQFVRAFREYWGPIMTEPVPPPKYSDEEQTLIDLVLEMLHARPHRYEDLRSLLADLARIHR